ncbi:MAG TPA: LytTR family DNA-binding domain-containing protein, partial [Chitinophagaceae bacterium]|nr:LytTR family DNA-binding domain-containing protein [Chitinophagaceae bacterium]
MGSYIYFKSGDTSLKVFLSDILYAKAERKYIRVVTTGKTHFVRGAISWLQESSSGQTDFCRIHKSYMVSLQHITGFDSKSVFIGDKKLPIGRHYKVDLLGMILPVNTGSRKAK